MDKLTREHFTKYVRDGLNHRHDPAYLRRSPLAALLGVADRYDMPSALRHILIQAIEALEPKPDVPSDSRAWRIYEALYYRYVQDFDQVDVAEQLGVSPRQLRREQRTALEMLSDQLWEQYGLGQQPQASKDSHMAEAEPALDEELAWLEKAPPESSADLSQMLPAAVALVQPLAAQHGVELQTAVSGTLPRVLADPVALRQTLVSLLRVAILRASKKFPVRVVATSLSWEVEIRVSCGATNSESRPITSGIAASLDMARRLTTLCRGKLVLSSTEELFDATLIYSALEQLPVLVVDDNAGTLHLLQRYTAGTRYRLVGTQDPQEALRLAETVTPQIIVLDIMMPNVDGWEVLGRLRQHPLIGRVPVIVCTILAEEDLALCLGASAFLRKPIARQVFLATLERLAPPSGIGSR